MYRFLQSDNYNIEEIFKYPKTSETTINFLQTLRDYITRVMQK